MEIGSINNYCGVRKVVNSHRAPDMDTMFNPGIYLVSLCKLIKTVRRETGDFGKLE